MKRHDSGHRKKGAAGYRTPSRFLAQARPTAIRKKTDDRGRRSK